MEPKIIAIEGIDGSGKGTQFELLADAVKQKGHRLKKLSFPNYESFFGIEIGKLLSGKEAERADTLDPKSMAVWYALDRYNSMRDIDIKNYDFIVLNRYTLSNAVYQGARVDENERDAFVKWVFELEFNELKLPIPTIQIILDVNPEASKQNVAKKGYRDYVGNGADVYEKSEGFMDKTRKMYLKLANAEPNIHIIDCMVNGEMLTADIIHNKIINLVWGDIQ